MEERVDEKNECSRDTKSGREDRRDGRQKREELSDKEIG